MVDNWSIKFLVPVIFFFPFPKNGTSNRLLCLHIIYKIVFLCFVLFVFGGRGDIINVVLSKHWCKLADTLPLYDVIQKILKYKCWHYAWQFSIEKVNKTCMKFILNFEIILNMSYYNVNNHLWLIEFYSHFN